MPNLRKILNLLALALGAVLLIMSFSADGTERIMNVVIGLAAVASGIYGFAASRRS